MKPCNQCAYYRRISTLNKMSMKVCHYLLDTGIPRPCPPDGCTCMRIAVTRSDYMKLMTSEFGGKALTDMMLYYNVKSLRRLSDAQAKFYYDLISSEPEELPC